MAPDIAEAKSDAGAIIEEVRSNSLTDSLVRGDLVAVPQGRRIEDLRQYERRATGSVNTEDVESFLKYVVDFYDPAITSAWVSVDTARMVAILNDHVRQGEPSDAGWRDHRALLTLRETSEWKRWTAIDRAWLDQADFAEHIADSIEDIASPTAGDLLELAQTFEATSNAEFKGGVRIDSGAVQVSYRESIDARAGDNGQLTIPKELILALAPFYGEDRIAVTARFRYRIREGKLKVGVVLEDPEKIRTACVVAAHDRVAAVVERTYLGTP